MSNKKTDKEYIEEIQQRGDVSNCGKNIVEFMSVAFEDCTNVYQSNSRGYEPTFRNNKLELLEAIEHLGLGRYSIGIQSFLKSHLENGGGITL